MAQQDHNPVPQPDVNFRLQPTFFPSSLVGNRGLWISSSIPYVAACKVRPTHAPMPAGLSKTALRLFRLREYWAEVIHSRRTFFPADLNLDELHENVARCAADSSTNHTWFRNHMRNQPHEFDHMPSRPRNRLHALQMWVETRHAPNWHPTGAGDHPPPWMPTKMDLWTIFVIGGKARIGDNLTTPVHFGLTNFFFYHIQSSNLQFLVPEWGMGAFADPSRFYWQGHPLFTTPPPIVTMAMILSAPAQDALANSVLHYAVNQCQAQAQGQQQGQVQDQQGQGQHLQVPIVQQQQQPVPFNPFSPSLPHTPLLNVAAIPVANSPSQDFVGLPGFTPSPQRQTPSPQQPQVNNPQTPSPNQRRDVLPPSSFVTPSMDTAGPAALTWPTPPQGPAGDQPAQDSMDVDTDDEDGVYERLRQAYLASPWWHQ
ncbi:hypothetical protein OQA88_7682 [Cercophora sp. LCS_1]